MIRQTPRSSVRLCLVFLAISTIGHVSTAAAQPAAAHASSAETGSAPYARKNSFGVLVAYSNDSSHILLGDAERRKLLNIGVSYSRLLVLTRFGAWTYDGELLPVALEGDPLTRTIVEQTEPSARTTVYDAGPLPSCAPTTQSYSYTDPKGVTYSGMVTYFCHGRQWTIGEAMSPVGLQWNFRPRSRIQPLMEGHGGYMYTTQPIPVFNAGSFNFTFDFGGGVEYFQSHSNSIRLEYRYHHISNHETAEQNPGIDSGLFQLSYVFGR